MIRFLIHTVSSKTDVNGNRYHYATVTATATGRSMFLIHLGGPSNAQGLIRNLLNLDWSAVHSTEESLPIRQWNQLNKFAKKTGKMEHQLTADDFLALEKP